jgi:F5/8 type C domain
MRDVMHILFGAVFTVAVSTAMGTLLLRRLGLDLYRFEAALFAFVAGSGLLSLVIALLCMVHQARRGVFLLGGMAVIAWALWRERGSPRRSALPPAPAGWPVLFCVLFAAFFICYFFNALAPEVSPDGSGYHLGNVLRIWNHHGFVWDYHSFYAYLSQGTEMLFLMAFAFGRHSAAAMVHCAFLTALPLLMVCYGRRFGLGRAALFAAILIYASPVIGMDGVAAYNDVAVATVIFAVFYALQVSDDSINSNYLILIGLLAGSAYGIKYTACLALGFAVAFAWWRWVKLRAVLLLCIPGAVIIAPWILRNWIWVGNPFAPFLNTWFPNPYYHAGMEKSYVDELSHYLGMHHNWEIPLQLTIRGGLVAGLFGPVFLLAPLALLGLRHRQGRRLLLAALVFALPAYFNTGARFLIPSAPFLALAMGLGLADSPGVLAAVAIFHAVVSWPSVLNTYCDPWAWRVSSVPVKAALRREPEVPYIERHLGDYVLKVPIEQNVPRGEKIFSFAGRPEAYIDRDIVVQYESTFGNLVQDILQAPAAHPPRHRQEFRFLPVLTRGIRVVNIASGENFWTVAEMRVLSQGSPVPRAAGWRVSAWPNGWEAPLAFDNSYATRWSTWQAMPPHARLQIDFARSERIDAVLLECEPAWEARVQVEVLTGSGRWAAITDTAEHSEDALPDGIRLAATRDVKARGIRYLWINDSDFCAEDMKNYTKFWGITQVAEGNGTRFYRID